MRNTSAPDSGTGATWATYARIARERAMLAKAEAARRLGVDRGTIHRWETGQNKPEDPEVLVAFAKVYRLDIDEVLAAAGMRPGAEPPSAPDVELDHEIELVRTDDQLDSQMKVTIINMILERRERQRAAALEETRRMIDLVKRQRRSA